MLCSAHHANGSAHFISSEDILSRCHEAKLLFETAWAAHFRWLGRLGDAELQELGISYAGPTLRRYLELAKAAARDHPYPSIQSGLAAPPLATVYVRQPARLKSAREPISAEALYADVESPRRPTLLVGDAGVGKSSFFRIAVTSLIERWDREPQDLVPVRVHATTLAAETFLAKAIASSVNQELGAAGLIDEPLPEQFFLGNPSAHARWLVLVDSLDEVIGADRREALLDRILALSEQPQCPYQFLIATRPLPELDIGTEPIVAVEQYELMPLTLSQLEELAGAWLRKLLVHDAEILAKRFLGRLNEVGLSDLARTPLMATMLCQIFAADPEQQLPSTRVGTYRKFIELLDSNRYKSARHSLREQMREVLSSYSYAAEGAGEDLVRRCDEIIGRVAWARQHGALESILDLVLECAQPWPRTDAQDTHWRGLAAEVLRRSGRITQRQGQLVFLHQTIEEYLAARHVAANPHRLGQEVAAVFDVESWRSGGVTTSRQSYARFLVAVCGSSPIMAEALTHFGDRGGINGGRFIATLKADGVDLSRDVVAVSCEQLRATRKSAHASEFDKRQAVISLLMLDSESGIETLVAIAGSAKEAREHRRWAITALMQHLRGEPPDTSQTDLDRRTMRLLAAGEIVSVRNLLISLTTDPVLKPQEQKWIATALGLGDYAVVATGALAGASERHPNDRPALPLAIRVSALLSRFWALLHVAPNNLGLEPVIAAHRSIHPKANIKLLQEAYSTARSLHDGQFRKSGDEYITHSLAVASILADLGMDTTTLTAGLLHGTLEDTYYTVERLRASFGDEVALLVDGATKLDRAKLGSSARAETIRKLIVATGRDPRVMVLKLANDLHDMRTVYSLPPIKREQKARETLEILAPLAHRLGMNTVKWELEDLSFATLFPKRFKEIQRLVGEHAPQQDELLRQLTDRVCQELRDAKINAKVTGRPKHLYSIYRRMIARSRDFNEIYDLAGVRILVDTVRDCYAALGVIHATWPPVPGRIQDYVATPKSNFYQALHTAVIGSTGKLVEIQILTHAMHGTAEYGVASMWKYKDGKVATVGGPSSHIDGMTWLRQLLDWQRQTSDPGEFLDALRHDLSSQEVLIFTHNGEVLALPNGSTPVDFAYAVHTEVGHRCVGARVNSKLVRLESVLSNGDIVEIFTSKSENAGPTKDWLAFVKSSRAKTLIRQYFNMERPDEAIDVGKDMLVRAIRRQGLALQRMLTAGGLLAIARELHVHDVSALYAAVGNGQISAKAVAQRLVAAHGGEEGAIEEISEAIDPPGPSRTRAPGYDPGIEVKGIPDAWIRLARCCMPAPGDTIFGFRTRSGGISVHRPDCPNSEELQVQTERLVEVEWKPTAGSVFLAAIQVEALDRHELLADVTRVLTDEQVNILSAIVTTNRDRIAVSRFSFEMADLRHLRHLLIAVRQVEGVVDCYRIASAS